MSNNLRTITVRWWICSLLGCMLCASAAVRAAPPEVSSAASLRAKYAALGEQLGHNQFHRPLYLESAESSGDLKGDIYAVVDYPFATVRSALNRPEQWCDVLILHVNTKYCHASAGSSGSMLAVNFGRKFAQPLKDTHRVVLAYRVIATTQEYLEIRLDAAKGPFGTSNYRIGLQAVSVANDRTFLHLTYAYAYGRAGRLGMQTYLATTGSDEEGFTVTGQQGDGKPEYIRGVRGVVERNTMRYYLAIDAYLGAAHKPPAEQLEQRLQTWFSSVEQYPRQLDGGTDRAAYLDMKRSEYLRQQTAQ